MKARKAAQALQTAMAFHRSGNIAAAETGYREVLALEPRNPDALHLLGVVVAGTGDLESGAALIKRALAIHADMPDAHFNLGNILARQSRYGEAEPHFRRVIAAQPGNAEAANNLGGALLHLERYEDAEKQIRRALDISPGSVTATANLAAVFEATGRFDQTLGLYDALLARQPSNVMLHHHKAMTLLLRQRFTPGWEEFAWRLKLPDSRGYYGRFAFPYWQGESLKDSGLLIWTEQGPGDEILIGTMIQDAINQAARVVLVCSPRLAPLFERAYPGVTVLAADGKPRDGAVLAGITFQASMSELGRWLRPDAAAFGGAKTTLTADPALTARLRAKYQAAHPHHKLVGISWRSKAPEAEREKSIALTDWQDILRTPGITFVNLQYGDTREDVDTLTQQGIPIIADSGIDPLKDMDAFAAQVAALDLVLSVSNTTVHVAGALGQPVWALIPSNRGRLWYWFLERSDSLWYPKLRLFRQAAGGWPESLAAMKTSLDTWRHLQS